jgi:hypothetical protein
MTHTPAQNSSRSAVSQQISFNGSVYIVLSVLILLAAALLRFYHLANRSLWYDEAVTANISRDSLDQMLRLTRKVSAPIVHPFLLYLAERIKSDAWMVRLPSALASLAAVLMMLVMPKVKANSWAALFAAAILSLSASQVRYAQEVREYSLSVFFAIVIMFCLLHWEAKGMTRHPFLLYVGLFLAPLVQYGLVLFGVAILATMLLRAGIDRTLSASWKSILPAATVFLAGSALSYTLTLRYQIRSIHLGTQSYLSANYFDPKHEGLLHYLARNTQGVFSFFMPGQILPVLMLISGAIAIALQLKKGKITSLNLLLVTSFSITILASIGHTYPYGGIRQCLFLSPVFILFAGTVIAELVSIVPNTHQSMTAVFLVAVIVASSVRGLGRQWPYEEYEDTQSILRELARSGAPGDQIWVNHDAVDAFSFYVPAGDPRFTYGKFHADTKDYMPALRAAIWPRTIRLWLVFSHLEQSEDYAEEQLILKELGPGWTIEKQVGAQNAELYLARRAVPKNNPQAVPLHKETEVRFTDPQS